MDASCHVILRLILSAMFLPPLVRLKCAYPEFVTEKKIWIATYDNEVFMKYDITEDTIHSSYCTHNGLVCSEYARKCNETHDRDKFIVEHIDKTQLLAQTMYLCMQFIKRSADVIQIKSSTKIPVKSPSMCDNLNLDVWPLTSPSFRTAPSIPCPFSGGYNMVIQNNRKQMCANKIPQARLESKCGHGTGIEFDFKHPECIHKNLKMDLIQNVDCMTMWTTGLQKFVIIRPDSDNFQPYCLRITEKSKYTMHAYLFMDFVCDPGNSRGIPTKTVNYLSVNFTRREVTLCEDEFQSCVHDTFCATDMEAHCKKTCNHCKPETSICTIPEYIRGTWGLIEKTNITSFIDISTYEFNQEDIGRFKCMKSNKSNRNQIVLLQTFENGCYPKFSCLEIFQISPSVIQFRIGKPISWPVFPLSDVWKLVCNKRQFYADLVFGKSKQTIEIQKTTAIDPNYFLGVDCGISDEFRDGVSSLYFQEGSKCDGCISFDERYDRTMFTVNPIECPDSVEEINYLCLGSFKLNTNSTMAVITKVMASKFDEFYCWVFTGSGINRKLIVMEVSDCNDISIGLVLQGELQPKAIFAIIEKPRKACPKRKFIPKERNVNSIGYKTNGNSVLTLDISGGASSSVRNMIFILSSLLTVKCLV